MTSHSLQELKDNVCGETTNFAVYGEIFSESSRPAQVLEIDTSRLLFNKAR